MALIHCQFHSDVLGLACAMDVILPQQATASQIGLKSIAAKTKKTPVLYLLHGLSDDQTIWQRRTNIERYVAPLGMAVVMPMAHRSYYTDMKSGYRYFTHIAQEVPSLARQFFGLSDRRQDNFVAGLSMGGYGALKIGLTFPDRFAAAASLSGVADLVHLIEHKTLGADRYAEQQWIFGDLKKVRGSENDINALATRAVKKGVKLPGIYQCCGTEDFLYPSNQSFRHHLEKLGVEFTYEETPGTHEWGYWDRMIQRVLTWLPLAKPKA